MTTQNYSEKFSDKEIKKENHRGLGEKLLIIIDTEREKRVYSFKSININKLLCVLWGFI
jgi:hypothetical protein